MVAADSVGRARASQAGHRIGCPPVRLVPSARRGIKGIAVACSDLAPSAMLTANRDWRIDRRSDAVRIGGRLIAPALSPRLRPAD
jgi:hypothetical protein